MALKMWMINHLLAGLKMELIVGSKHRNHPRNYKRCNDEIAKKKNYYHTILTPPAFMIPSVDSVFQHLIYYGFQVIEHNNRMF